MTLMSSSASELLTACCIPTPFRGMPNDSILHALMNERCNACKLACFREQESSKP